MQKEKRDATSNRWPLAFSACCSCCPAARAGSGQEAGRKTADRSALDESIHQSLRGIIDRGANLYNQGDWNGCYRLWEGAMMALRPVLEHRPNLPRRSIPMPTAMP